MARREDIEAVPAWLNRAVGGLDPWPSLREAAAERSAAELLERAALLAIPCALLGEVAPGPLAMGRPLGGRRPAVGLDGALVVDLSSLWAGPLCTSLLAAAGATVVKVESTHRPDGAREGHPGFFDLVNAGKRAVALDLMSAEGVAALHRLLAAATIVVEGSRPRALEQLGVDVEAVASHGVLRVWISITGYGRWGAGAGRVAFGDDAAVAGGLVGWDHQGPCFCADAAADPATGLVAATAGLDRLAEGGCWLVDVALARVAAALARAPGQPGKQLAPAARPRARVPAGRGPALGEHTAEVLQALDR